MDTSTVNPAVNHPDNLTENPQRRLLDVISANLQRTNRVHSGFLKQQAANLKALAASIATFSLDAPQETPRAPLINRDQLEEFSRGSIAKCFGPDFAILDQRKSARIPNGDLLMVDRVLDIKGQRGQLQQPADITTEYQTIPHAWYFEENPYPGLPLGLLMEIALQPCGILSAYLGTALQLPPDVNIFRNLDGQIHFKASPPPAGALITNRARLLSSLSLSGMLLQEFAFELSVGGQTFLEGQSSFGYFRQAEMEKEGRLDESAPLDISAGFRPLAARSSRTAPDVPHPHLDLIEGLVFKENAGKFGRGLLVGERRLDGNEWFYRNHFYQDPVMPGSLGVEAMLQAMWSWLQERHAAPDPRRAAVGFGLPEPLEWKYRGQVTPLNRALRFELHLKNELHPHAAPALAADADFFVDDRKIYAIRNLALALKEGNLL